jgi:hypothetical protein
VPAWAGGEARRLYPGWRCTGTFDVSGGWYDAGDDGKYVTSGAIAVWQLLGTLDLLRRADSSPPIRTFADAIRSECLLHHFLDPPAAVTVARRTQQARRQRYSSLSDMRLAASRRRRASVSTFTASSCRDWASARCR